MSRAKKEKKRVYLYATTLRDGGQTQGIDFSVRDKQVIAQWEDMFGFPYCEMGWPGANPTDTELFENLPILDQAKSVAFGMTRRANCTPEEDEGLQLVLKSPADAVCLVGKASAEHVTDALKVSLDENLEIIRSTIREAKRHGKEVLFDAEHFFDGAKVDLAYSLACLKAAHEAGADWLVLCDTNGGALPQKVRSVVKRVKKELPDARLGFHGHNDMGLAVANSLEAVEAGCTMVQGTLNGIGERCGNANLITLVPILHYKMGYDIGLTDEGVRDLTELSRAFDELLDRDSDAHAPFVGRSFCAHKGGLHGAGVAKKSALYESTAPELVGGERQILISNQAGLANVRLQLAALGIEVEDKDPRLPLLLDAVKAEEKRGVAFDRAAASFGILALKTLGQMPSFFSIKNFSVFTQGAFNGETLTRPMMKSTAYVRMKVGEEIVRVKRTGKGPVHALDEALRASLVKVYPELADVHLTNYHVRILDQKSATGAKTRVLLESEDEATKTSWTTTGVSTDIIRASFEALLDSYLFKLCLVKKNDNAASCDHPRPSAARRKYRYDGPRHGELRPA